MLRGVQILSSTQALLPGADLWILPHPEVSAISRSVDWYLNFQMSRGLQNKPRRRSDTLESLLRTIKWALPATMEPSESPLLIAASGRLPAQWVLMPSRWTTNLEFLHQAAPLKPQRVRLFLPATLSPDVFRATTAGPALAQLLEKFEIEVLAES